MSPRRSVDITAPRPRAQRHSGKIQLMGFHRDNRRPVHVSTQYDLFKSQPFLILLENRQELFFIPPKIARQEPQGVFWVIGVFGNEKQIERRTTIHHELSLAVNNHSPRSRHSLDTDAIVLRQKGVTFTLDDLEKHEPRDQGQKDDRQDIIEPTGARAEFRRTILSVDVGKDSHAIILWGRLPFRENFARAARD